MIALAFESGVDGILAVGGGSVIECLALCSTPHIDMPLALAGMRFV